MAKVTRKRPLRYTIRYSGGVNKVTVESKGGRKTIDRSTLTKEEDRDLTFQLTKAFREVYVDG